jgi:hypothetical protein
MRERFINYWARPLPQMESGSPLARVGANQTKTLVTVSFLGVVAALFQSAGGFLPGPGYLISPLSTAPIALATLLSFRSGLMAYALSSLLLLLIQPSELIVFPFTTGLLGMALGTPMAHSKNRMQVVFFSAAALWAGIAVVLYVLRFPLFGSPLGMIFRMDTTLYVFIFCLLYSGLWTEICLLLLAKLNKSAQGKGE